MNHSLRFYARGLVLAAFLAPAVLVSGQEAPDQDTSSGATREARASLLRRAARDGDLTALRSALQQGADPDARDLAGRTALLDAVSADRAEAVQVLLAAGADVNAASSNGRTPLIEAAELGRVSAARLLIAAGAELDHSQRGWGTPLDVAERMGHNQLAALLIKSGSRTSGKSIGDTVCVRPWKGDGYCGTVEEINRTAYRIRVTEVVGCKNGCEANADCSAGRIVGGASGLRAGDEITTVSWCLTHTGVQP